MIKTNCSGSTISMQHYSYFSLPFDIIWDLTWTREKVRKGAWLRHWRTDTFSMIWKLARKEQQFPTSPWSQQNGYRLRLFPFFSLKHIPSIMSTLIFCFMRKNCFSLFHVFLYFLILFFIVLVSHCLSSHLFLLFASSVSTFMALFFTLWLSSGGVGREEGGSERKRWGWGSGVHYRGATGSWWVGCWRRAVHGLRHPWPGKQGGLLSRPGFRLPIMDNCFVLVQRLL